MKIRVNQPGGKSEHEKTLITAVLFYRMGKVDGMQEGGLQNDLK